MIQKFIHILKQIYIFLRGYKRKGNIQSDKEYYSRLCEYGDVCIDSEDFNEAEECFIEASKLEPLSSRPYLGLGSLSLKLKNFKQALNNFEKALELNPNSQLTHLGFGELFLNLRKYETAIEYYQKSTKFSPYNYIAFNKLGYIFFKLEEYEKAKQYCIKAIELNPEKDSYPRYLLGDIYIKLKLYNEAISEYKKGLVIRGRNPHAYYTLGFLNLKLKNYTKSIEWFLKAIERNPQDMMSYYNLASLYEELSNFQKAKMNYIKAYELNPYSSISHNGINIVNHNYREYNDMTGYFKEKKSRQCYNKDSKLNLGIISYNQDDYNEAKKVYNLSLGLYPNNVFLYHKLGNLYYDLKEFDKAKEYYDNAIKIDPNYVILYYSLGCLYQDLKEINEAINCYKKAIEIDAEFSNSYHNLGYLYFELKEYNNAIEQFEFFTLKSLKPSTENLYFLLKLYKITKKNIDKYLSDNINTWSHLSQLNLSSLDLKFIPKSISKLTQVQTIDLSNNGISSINTLLDFSFLTKINLSYNSTLTILPYEILKSDFTTVELTGTGIGSIPFGVPDIEFIFDDLRKSWIEVNDILKSIAKKWDTSYFENKHDYEDWMTEKDLENLTFDKLDLNDDYLHCLFNDIGIPREIIFFKYLRNDKKLLFKEKTDEGYFKSVIFAKLISKHRIPGYWLFLAIKQKLDANRVNVDLLEDKLFPFDITPKIVGGEPKYVIPFLVSLSGFFSKLSDCQLITAVEEINLNTTEYLEFSAKFESEPGGDLSYIVNFLNKKETRFKGNTTRYLNILFNTFDESESESENESSALIVLNEAEILYEDIIPNTFKGIDIISRKEYIEIKFKIKIQYHGPVSNKDDEVVGF